MLNCAVIMGRLTADPELRTTQSGLSVTSFTVAVDRAYKSGDERQTDFINVVAWRGTADFVSRFFKKGQMIAVQGSIQTRNYEDKNGNRFNKERLIAYAEKCHYVVSVMRELDGEVWLYNYDVTNDELPDFLKAFEKNTLNGKIIEIEKYFPEDLA